MQYCSGNLSEKSFLHNVGMRRFFIVKEINLFTRISQLEQDGEVPFLSLLPERLPPRWRAAVCGAQLRR